MSGQCCPSHVHHRPPTVFAAIKVLSLDTVSGQRCPTHVHRRPLTVFAAYKRRYRPALLYIRQAISLYLHTTSRVGAGRTSGVSRGGDLTAEIAYGNHPGIAQHDVAIHNKIFEDIVYGRALVLDLRFAGEISRLFISPLSVVLEPKFWIFHHLTFARAGDRTSVDDDPDLDSAPPSELGHVLREVLKRVVVREADQR